MEGGGGSCPWSGLVGLNRGGGLWLADPKLLVLSMHGITYIKLGAMCTEHNCIARSTNHHCDHASNEFT